MANEKATVDSKAKLARSAFCGIAAIACECPVPVPLHHACFPPGFEEPFVRERGAIAIVASARAIRFRAREKCQTT